MHEISLSDVSSLVGQELGTSKWITIDQAMINLFADATHDHQFIHVDPNRTAAESPFGGTIAHGFLTLALLSVMNFSGMPKFREQTMGINYGFTASASSHRSGPAAVCMVASCFRIAAYAAPAY